MKVVILAGGLGSRLGSLTSNIPKPMIMIKDKPIIYHIMETYSSYGFNDFIIALGYKGDIIKEYFKNFYSKNNDLQINLSTNKVKYLNKINKKWEIKLIDTGEDSLTGTRLKKLYVYLKNEKNFMLTYGDGLSNVNLKQLLKFHKENNKIATLTAVRPPARYGELSINGNLVQSFKEKKQLNRGWINGGYFVFNSKIFDYLDMNKNIMLERDPIDKLVKVNQLNAFKHEDYWQCLDTPRDYENLNKINEAEIFPWLKK